MASNFSQAVASRTLAQLSHTIRAMTYETDKRRGLANRFVPITYPPCRKCGMPMRLGFVEPLDEPGHERRLYECLSCKYSVNFVIKVP